MVESGREEGWIDHERKAEEIEWLFLSNRATISVLVDGHA